MRAISSITSLREKVYSVGIKNSERAYISSEGFPAEQPYRERNIGRRGQRDSLNIRASSPIPTISILLLREAANTPFPTEIFTRAACR